MSTGRALDAYLACSGDDAAHRASLAALERALEDELGIVTKRSSCGLYSQWEFQERVIAWMNAKLAGVS